MKNLRPFQIALLVGFGVVAIVAVFILANYQSQQSQEDLLYGDRVEIWGTLEANIFNDLFISIRQTDRAFNVVNYREINEADFDDVLVNAIAEGRSPDMIVLASDKLVKHRNKLLAIPYENFPERDFRDLYVDGAEIFTMIDGVYAVPFAVDPLIMYWNRDLFASGGLAQPPTTWETVVNAVVPSVTVRTDARDIITSGLAFGEYRNVYRAKDILLMLAIQSGSQLVYETERNYEIALNNQIGEVTGSPLESSVRFFTDFSNVNNALYSWNRIQPLDSQAFIAGDLALYFGRASEVQSIADRNPNLNFDTAMVPQGGSATARRTYGTFYGFAFPQASANVTGAYNAAQTISNFDNANALTTALNMGPARRDIVSAGSGNAFRVTALQSSLIAKSWLDPEPVASDNIFKQMIEDLVSNRVRIGVAVNDAINRLVLEY